MCVGRKEQRERIQVQARGFSLFHEIGRLDLFLQLPSESKASSPKLDYPFASVPTGVYKATHNVL
jgi:hypothetical protein